MKEFNPFDNIPDGLSTKEQAQYIVDAMIKRNKEIKERGFKPLRTITGHKNNDYMICTTDTFDLGLETIVLPVVKNKIIYIELYKEYHDTNDEAIKRHDFIADNIGSFVL